MKPMFTSEALSDDDVFREVFFLVYGSSFPSRRACSLALNEAIELPQVFKIKLFPEMKDFIRGGDGVFSKIVSLLDNCVLEIEQMDLNSIYSIREFNDKILMENEKYKSLYLLYSLCTKFYELDKKLSARKEVYNKFTTDNRKYLDRLNPTRHITNHPFFQKIQTKGWKTTNFYIIFEISFFATILETGLYFGEGVSNAVWYTWLDSLRIAALLYNTELYTWKEASNVY